MLFKQKSTIIPNSIQTKGLKEYSKATIYYGTPQTKSYKFRVYKSEDIEESLEKIFSKKCAYCESDYKAAGNINIEHFRPKGEVELFNGTKLFPGYWWLAADWDNLLPSCTRCNVIHTYKDSSDNDISLGKGSYFPIDIDDNVRSIPTIGDELREIPLLINPTVDDPNHYLYFDFTHNLECIVKIKPNLTSKERLKAENSINLYALNREDLVFLRTKQIKLLYLLLNGLKNNINLLFYKTTFGERKLKIKEIMNELNEIFDTSFNKKEIYFAAKVSFVGVWFEDFDIKYKKKFYKYYRKFITK